MADRTGIEVVDLPFHVFAALFAVLLAFACVPLLLTPLPPLVDYPNHLARMHVLANWSRASLLRQYYVVAWRPLPDLAMDVVVPPLLGIVSLQTAGKLFLAAAYALSAGGVAALHRAIHGRWSAWPLTVFLLVYNRLLLWGLVNFLFGLGLAFWALAGWIIWRERNSSWRLMFGFIAALSIYFAHLMAFGIYGAMILGYEVGRSRHHRETAAQMIRAVSVTLLPFLPPLALFGATLVSLHAGGSLLSGIRYSQPGRKLDLLFSIFDLYNRPFDVACFVIAIIAMAVAYWRRWLRLAPGIGAPLLLLMLLYLAMPSTLFGATGADRRMPLAMAMLLVGGSAWQVPFARDAKKFLAATLMMFAVRIGVVAVSWHASGQIYSQLLTGLDALPRGARIAVAFSDDEINVGAVPLLHFPVLVVARRDAFVPTLFAYPMQQPVAFADGYGVLAAQLSSNALWRFYVDGKKPMPPTLAQALAHCDYITFAARHAFVIAATSGLTPIFVAPEFQIYRLTGSSS
ncbi:MAG: hypothetical protein KGJ66_05535 [Alphaproteobacteria bacterium]|nr:hypothetical protein [Alphaproteobacteria bacterium]